VKSTDTKKSGLFGLFRRKVDPNERLPGQKLPVPEFDEPSEPNKRAISGDRVVCKCSMQLPKTDTFNQLKIHRNGVLIFNTRGGAFYLSDQFTEENIHELFEPGQSGVIKNFKLYPPGGAEVSIGQISARFLYFTNTHPFKGMVLRFGKVSERQLKQLNELTQTLTKVGPSEQDFINKALAKREK